MKRAPACTICGQPAPRGARLCTPCHAALKRAGQRTVQDLPHYRDPVPRPRRRRRDPADAGDAEHSGGSPARVTSSDRGRRLVLAAAALAALAGVAYLGQPQWRASDGTPASADDGVPASPPEAVARPQPVAAVAPAPATPVTVGAAPPAVRPSRATGDVSGAAPRANPPQSRAEPPTQPTAYPSLEAFGAIAEAPRRPPTPPAAAPRPAPPPDRWQQMSDALAQCEREGGFSGFLCDQRTRIDACEGYWGRVPQCPAMPENPR